MMRCYLEDILNGGVYLHHCLEKQASLEEYVCSAYVDTIPQQSKACSVRNAGVQVCKGSKQRLA
jgi:hypothetical protein